MATLTEAIALLESGDWQAAHLIVQDDPGLLASWAHGIVHLLEGDRANAGYWYRQAQRSLPNEVIIKDEIAALRRTVVERGNATD